MAAFYESDDKSVVEFQLGNKQLFFLFLGLLVICAIFFFIGLRVGEDTAKGKIPFDLGGGGQAERSANLAQTQDQIIEEKPVTKTEKPRQRLSEPTSQPKVKTSDGGSNKPSAADQKVAKQTVTDNGQKDSAAGTVEAKSNEVKASPGGHFYLQVSSQSSKESADKLQKRLAATMPVMVEEAVVKGKTYYRVLVGPYDTREKADEVKAAMESSFPKAFVQKK